MRIEVRTSRLDEVLQRIRQMHPIRGNAGLDVSASLLDEVLEKLTACSFKDLRNLAFSFDHRRILACLEILVTYRKDDLAKKAAQVLSLRPRDQVILRGWFKLVRHYPHDLLEETLRELLGGKGLEFLEKRTNVSSRVAYWFISSDLAAGILRDYTNVGGYDGLDGYLTDNLLKDEDGLYEEVWRRLLMKGDATSIKKETPERILDEFADVMNAPHVPSFGQHYLNALESKRNWDEPILDFIVEKFGVPSHRAQDAGVETEFWRGVSGPAKHDFRTWHNLRRIEAFFEGKRADFWRRYVEVDKVRRVNEILNGKGFMLDFGSFGVVEFKDIGNAAYVYPRGVFKTFWDQAHRWDYPSMFKKKRKTLRHEDYPWWDGRIFHMRGWQSRTAQIINRLLDTG